MTVDNASGDNASGPPTATRAVLLDVARLAGVSRTTASFVLTGRNDMGISAAAADRVRQAARDLGYRPSLLAKSLRMNSSHTIGLLSDGFGGGLFAGELIQGGLAAAVLHDKMIFVGETGGDPLVETRLINSMLDRGARAFVYASRRLHQVRLSTLLRAQQVVLVNCTIQSRDTATVIPDERGAGRSLAMALIQRGHRDGILVVGRAGPGDSAGLRIRGITDALRTQGARVAAIIDSVSQPGPAAVAVGRILGAAPRPTALICLDNRIAMGAYQAVRDCGLSVPDDVSVVSFGDSQLATWLEPQLTSAAIPFGELARQAVEILVAPEKPFGAQYVAMPLVQGSSVGPPGSGRDARRDLSSASSTGRQRRCAVT